MGRDTIIGRRSSWGVFPHSIERAPTGRGYVARSLDPDTGGATDHRNKLQHAAERYAESLS